MSPIITPRCERCGGLRPEYARVNRRRLGAVAYGLMACCCDQPVFSRWRKCGSLTGEIYTRDVDSAPSPFAYNGHCWSLDTTGQSLPDGATLLEAGDWTINDLCCECGGCDTPPPGSGRIRIAFAGISIVGACLPGGPSGWWKLSGPFAGVNLNFTHEEDAGQPCSAADMDRGTVTNGTAVRYTDGTCSTLEGGSDFLWPGTLRFSMSMGFGGGTSNIRMWIRRFAAGSYEIFNAPITTPGPNNCFDSFVVSNTLNSGGTAEVEWF